MKIFNRKRVALGLIVILVIVAFFVYKNKEYLQQLPIGCAFKTKALCAAVFVSGRDPVTTANSLVVRLGMTYDENWGMELFIKNVLDAIR